MNFFQAQDRARRNTLLLVALFAAAVALTIAVVYFGLTLFVARNEQGGAAPAWPGDYGLLLDVTVGVLAFVTLGSLYKVITLSGGGGKVAQAMGGRLVPLATRDADERRLLNVVDEMAIAAGAPIPDVYLLPDGNINAFAAGTTPHNAAIGVTRGCLRHLSRAQLQGVVAHEFSHIMNGDMRLNIRLIAIIHGLMLLGYLGYFLLRGALYSSLLSGSRSDNQGRAGLAIAGALLVAAGFVGTFFGSWIRAAVSRQREYLADAAAVQYTRYPDGIAGALERIGQLSGQLAVGNLATGDAHRQQMKNALVGMTARMDDGDEIGNSHAIEYSHLFFSNAVHVGFANPFATHPPLESRIARIMPNWSADNPLNTSAPAAAPAAESTPPPPAAAQSGKRAAQDAVAAYSGLFGASDSAGFAASAVVGQLGTVNVASIKRATKIVENIPPVLARAVENPYSARALVYVMLLDKRDEDSRAAQLAHLRAHADTGVYDLTMALMPEIAMLKPAARLPLLQLLLPALRQLSKRQYELFLNNMAALIAVDKSIELFEWCIQAIIVHALHDHFNKGRRRVRGDKNQAMAYALSILAKIGQRQPVAAFAHACEQTGLPLTFTDDDFEPQRLFDSLQTLSALFPKKKEQFSRAAALCAAYNDHIDANEATLLRAYFMIIDCPLPLQVADAA